MDVQQIVGTARTVSQLLSNSRYGLDFYQREYSWERAASQKPIVCCYACLCMTTAIRSSHRIPTT